MFARDGAVFTREDLSRALTRAWEEVHAAGGADRYGGVRGEIDFWKTFLGRVRGMLDGGVASEDAFARLAGHFRDPSSWAVYREVPETLDRLSGMSLSLAVVSNWDSALPGLLEGLDLARRFATVAVSALEGTGKPDPEIFQRTCRRLGVAPEQALHVGDSPREDYDGARSAGLHALLLDRQGRHGGRPDTIASLAEIPSWLQTCNAAPA